MCNILLIFLLVDSNIESWINVLTTIVDRLVFFSANVYIDLGFDIQIDEGKSGENNVNSRTKVIYIKKTKCVHFILFSTLPTNSLTFSFL